MSSTRPWPWWPIAAVSSRCPTTAGWGGGRPCVGGCFPSTACASPGHCARRPPATPLLPTRPFPTSWRPAAIPTGRAVGLMTGSPSPTPRFTRQAMFTASRPGMPRVGSSAGCTGCRSAGCSPGSRCSTTPSRVGTPRRWRCCGLSLSCDAQASDSWMCSGVPHIWPVWGS